jgi:Zn-finger nucleic acid-binding protein
MRSEAEVAAMSCPACRVPLAMSERQGIEIDYCPQCRGVWLDRGELDKIVERSLPAAAAPAAAPAPAPAARPAPPPSYPSGGYDSRPREGYGGHGDYRGKPYKKRKSWLSELFDD